MTPTQYSVEYLFNLESGELLVDVRVDSRIQRDGSYLWVIYDSGAILDKSGVWRWEGLPSSRGEEFIKETRFATAEEACAFFVDNNHHGRNFDVYSDLVKNMKESE